MSSATDSNTAASDQAHDGRLRAVELETGERVERDAGFISDEYSRPNVGAGHEQLEDFHDWRESGEFSDSARSREVSRAVRASYGSEMPETSSPVSESRES